LRGTRDKRPLAGQVEQFKSHVILLIHTGAR
jgi:hypothetical protein